tara:strand:- start:492 stop:797 length:306 start_codon:yes stop_codon:yes gene_type:complete
MRDTKHTPGPWVAKKLGEYLAAMNPNLWGEVQYGNIGEVVCENVYEEADARLIAAAPDMLEALIKCHDSILAMQRPDHAAHEDVRIKAKAAIAAATGKEQS